MSQCLANPFTNFNSIFVIKPNYRIRSFLAIAAMRDIAGQPTCRIYNQQLGAATAPATPHEPKSALANATQMMAKEWGPDGIRAVCIAPGLVRTELAEPLVKLVEEHGLNLNPLGYIGNPDDIAGLALLCASDAGKFFTSATLVVDGGELAMGPFG